MSSQLNISNIKPLTGSGTINIGSTSSNSIQINTTTQTVTSVGTLEGNTIKGIGANTVNYTTPMTVGGETLAGKRNIVINGAMQVAQRSTSETGLGAGGSSGYHTCDRWRLDFDATAGALTMSQATVSDLPGFSRAIKLDCTTADTSIAAGEKLKLEQRFEGQDLQQLLKGTSSAKQVTVSFYAKGTAATYMAELDDSDNNRFNGVKFTVGTDWTRHSITFAADTTGALDNDNALSLTLAFWLHAGSTFSGGSYTANTWQSRAASDANRAVGIGSIFSSTDNELQITGVQMEVGTVATPFEYKTVQEEFDCCYRYYYKQIGNSNSGVCHNWTTSQAHGYIRLPKPMRANPTGGNSTSGNLTFYTDTSRTSDMSSNTSWNVSNNHFPFIQISGFSQTAGHAGWYALAAGVYLELDAEL